MYSDCVEEKFFEESDGTKYKKWIQKHDKIYKLHWVENGIVHTKDLFVEELLSREELMYGLGTIIKADIYKS